MSAQAYVVMRVVEGQYDVLATCATETEAQRLCAADPARLRVLPRSVALRMWLGQPQRQVMAGGVRRSGNA